MVDVNVCLFNDDCLAKLPTLPAGCVDMILCDLPYGVTGCSWDSIIPVADLWQQYRRLIKGNGAIVLFGTEPFSTTLRAAALDLFKYDWIWEKTIAGDCMNAKNKPLRKHEVISVFSAGTTANGSARKMLYNAQGLMPTTGRKRVGKDYGGAHGGSFKQARPSHGAYVQELTGYPTSILKVPREDKAVHPTQKPVALLEYLIKTYTNPGATVLDNTMGSGSTGVACVRSGRDFIGIEKDAGYFAGAYERIKKELNP